MRAFYGFVFPSPARIHHSMLATLTTNNALPTRGSLQFSQTHRMCVRERVFGTLQPRIKQGCGSGSRIWKRKRWKRSFFCGSGTAKILPLPLPHRLFDLESNMAKKFCPFPNVDLSGEVALSLNERATSVARENEIKHNQHPWHSS